MTPRRISDNDVDANDARERQLERDLEREPAAYGRDRLTPRQMAVRARLADICAVGGAPPRRRRKGRTP